MAKPKRKTKKSPAKRHAPVKVGKDFAKALEAIRRVPVPKNLLPIKERAMNSIINLNDRINAEAGKVAKIALRDVKKAERTKAKAEREAAKVVRQRARAKKIQARITALQAELKKAR